MLFPEEFITEIREANDIVEVISNYVSLKKGGANYKGLCPFHSEKTPSFMVSPAKQIFHCFGCGEGGNVIHFMMKQEKMHFPDAVTALAERCGKPLPTLERVPEDPARKEAKARLYEINRAACEFFRQARLGNPAALRYLKDRGILEKSLSTFAIGFAPDAWESLNRHLTRQGFKAREQEQAGLVLQRQKGDGVYDRFRNRVIFPIVDIYDRPIGFGGRVLDDSTPKYLNSPETPIFDKGANLYGLNLAYEAIRKQDYVILVEGYMDVITAHQEGILNIVATLGTALTERHLRKLRRYTRNLALFFDSDAAGLKAAERSFDLCVPAGIKVKVVTLPDGEDPDSFIRARGKAGFSEAMAGAQPIMDFMMEQSTGGKTPETVEEKVAVTEKLAPLLSRIPDAVEQELYLKKAASLLGVKDSTLLQKMQSGRRRPSPGKRAAKKPEEKNKKRRIPVWERDFVGWMVEHPEEIGKLRERIVPGHFLDPGLRKVVEAIQKLPDSALDRETVSARIQQTDPQLAGSLSQYSLEERDLPDIQGLLGRLELEHLRNRLTRLQEKLINTEKGSEEETQFLLEKNQLRLQVENLTSELGREKRACPSN
ncbi:MAG: DNA primase [Deltaproteobacteria bacterium]|nr:DNA primase [Deltaproteobacteria bacterium]